MAVYRSDQAQVTFATEAAQGGDPEMMEGTAGSSTALLNADANAGARTITVDTIASASIVVGDMVRIGTVESTAANTYREHEVRRVEAFAGTQQVGTTPGNTITLTLDRPLAFFHADNEEVKEVTAIGGAASRNDDDKYITYIPGVYETVDTPDPEMSHEGRRFLGTQSKRNWSYAYPGQQTLTGSISGIILLNGWPLRFPIGSVVTTPQTKGSTGASLHGEAKKGDIFIRIDNGSGSAVTAINTAAAAGGYVCIDDGSATKSEVRRFAQAVVNTTYYKLNAPLQFDHADDVSVETCDADGGDYFDHKIIEQVDLDSVSWHVHMKDSGETVANNFDRRYVGGKIDSTTITAEEGGMVTMSWDGVNFLNMVHNQLNQSTVSTNIYSSDSTGAGMPRYGLMQAIDSDDIGQPGTNNNTGYPSTQPYYYSEGTVKFFSQTFARIRSFSLSIANGSEPRYYIGKQGARARGPYEIKEGPREYSMSCSVALPDTEAATGTDQSTALELFKQLLLEGDYGGLLDRRGFTASLKFERAANDYIIIDIPRSSEGGTIGSPLEGTDNRSRLNEQGIFINTAPHSLTTDNPFQVDLDMIFRSIEINIRDTVPTYP